MTYLEHTLGRENTWVQDRSPRRLLKQQRIKAYSILITLTCLESNLKLFLWNVQEPHFMMN